MSDETKTDAGRGAGRGSEGAHAIELLFKRAMQRAVKGDWEPVYWQGISVDHVHKFDSRVQIEMLRALMPTIVNTLGSAGMDVDTGDKILVLDDLTWAKLIGKTATGARPHPQSRR